VAFFGPVVGEFAMVVGLLAGTIAVGGFIAHVPQALSDASESEIRKATVLGGSAGLCLALVVVVLSASIANLFS
jgi:hypothetical protein